MKDKRKTWPLYLTSLRSRVSCPTALLVVAPEASVARWCAQPIELGHPGFVAAVEGLEAEKLRLYVDLALSSLNDVASEALEVLMRSGTYEYQRVLSQGNQARRPSISRIIPR